LQALTAFPLKRKGALSVLFVTIFLDLMGFGLIIPILPTLSRDLGAPYWQIGTIAIMFPLMQFLFASFWGGLSDRYGRRPIMLASIFITALAYLFFAHATTIFLLFFSRALSGFGAANLSVAQAYISDVTEPQNRTKAFGIIGAAFGLGFIFGPPIGGYLKENFGLIYVGYAAAGFSALNLIMAYFMLPESLKKFTADRKLFPNPFSDVIDGFKTEKIGSLLLINFVYIAAFSMMQVTAALLWEEEYDLTEAQVGYTFSYIGILAVVIQGFLIGWFSNKLGEKRLLIAGNLLMFFGLLLLPFVPKALFIPLELILLAILSLGNSFLTPTINTLLSNNTDRQDQGKILGTNQSVGSLARVLGPQVGTALYGIAYYFPYVAAAVIMLLVAWLSFRLIKKHLTQMQQGKET
jgi:DHA1 family tetracycline resistance protein-like MFS transporter